jgi:hypothetical protein
MPRFDRELKVGPLVMGILAAIGTQAFRLSCQWDPWIVWSELGLTVALFAIVYWLRSCDATFGYARREAWSRSTVAASICYLLAVVLPVLVQLVARPFGMGDPAEVVMLTMLQNGALATIAISSQQRPMLISILLSSFQLLFVGFAFAGPLTYTLAGIGTFVVLWWLMGNYWSRVESHQASRVERRIPMRGRVLLGTAGVIGLVLLLVTPFLPHRALAMLQGFMPTSGGEWWGDEFARSGLGNGEILTGATEQADTIGPVDSDVYLSSQQPSLYDMLSMVYGKPNKNHERRIDVTGQEIQEHGHEKMQETAASKEFSTSRKSRRQKVKLDRRNSPALLFVQGQVPLHVRLQAFDQFDGVTWQPAARDAAPDLEMVERNGKHWMRYQVPRSNVLTPGSQWHNICVVNLQTKIIPHSPLLAEWHVPKVNSPSYYGWAVGDAPEMSGRERIPVLTPVDQLSLVPNRYELMNYRASLPPLATETRYLERLGLQGKFYGTAWQKIEQVEAWLRTQFEMRHDAEIPEEITDTVDYFFDQRGGPDFLFATTAVCVLRELGIPARLVQGFYADPAEYDRKAKKTVVWPDNVHTWAEVCLDGRQWLPIEPSAGYELPQRALTRWQWLSLTVQSLLALAVKNIWLLGTLSLVAIAGWFRRDWLVDRGCQWSWNLLGWLPSAVQVRLCLWLLHQRARVAGISRRHTETWRAWYRRSLAGQVQPQSDGVVQAAQQIFGWLDQILYRPVNHPWGLDRKHVHQVCRLVLSQPLSRKN